MSQNSKSSPSLKYTFIFISILVLFLLANNIYLLFQNNKLSRKATDLLPEPNISNEINEPGYTPGSESYVEPEAIDNRKIYKNTDFGFSFRLVEGEHAVTCDNKNEYNDNVSVWISTMSGVVGNAECASGGSITAIFASRKTNEFNTVDEYLSGLSRDYIFDQTDIVVSGISAIRVTGEKSSEPSPLPNEIDSVVLSSNGVLYVFDAFYLSRDFQVIE